MPEPADLLSVESVVRGKTKSPRRPDRAGSSSSRSGSATSVSLVIFLRRPVA
jgi:Asp-tRNA(Asn)/Glu-tRNA(Gln) amidotransferase A subunit family amidase